MIIRWIILQLFCIVIITRCLTNILDRYFFPNYFWASNLFLLVIALSVFIYVNDKIKGAEKTFSTFTQIWKNFNNPKQVDKYPQ